MSPPAPRPATHASHNLCVLLTARRHASNTTAAAAYCTLHGIHRAMSNEDGSDHAACRLRAACSLPHLHKARGQVGQDGAAQLLRRLHRVVHQPDRLALVQLGELRHWRHRRAVAQSTQAGHVAAAGVLRCWYPHKARCLRAEAVTACSAAPESACIRRARGARPGPVHLLRRPRTCAVTASTRRSLSSASS